MGREIRPVAETITTSNREELCCAHRVITLRGDCSQRIQSEADIVLHHGYETSGCIVHAAKSMTLCWSALI
jgi:hypothetical protein